VESTDCVVKLKDADMYAMYTVSVTQGSNTATSWDHNGYQLTDTVVNLLAECEYGYTVLASHEIKFDAVEDAVRFKLLYQS
jgi:hypothetical protein